MRTLAASLVFATLLVSAAASAPAQDAAPGPTIKDGARVKSVDRQRPPA